MARKHRGHHQCHVCGFLNLLPVSLTTSFAMSSALPTIAGVFNEPHHPLRRCGIFILAVKALAHAVELAALQALVELAAFAEGAHDHVGGDGEQAQVFFGARCAAAEVAFDERADFAVIKV